ncbi:MAG: zinc ribbon domain-containing protein [Methylococcaceae bacterium]
MSSSVIAQLRSMLDYKSRTGGVRYIEVNSRNSTRICSACGSLTGPQGRAGLKVRQWECIECGTQHDRDVNAAFNTLTAAVGMTVEVEVRYAA